MLLALLYLAAPQQGPTLAELDKLARAKDAVTLRTYVKTSDADGRKAITLIKSGGAYGVGGFGWHAEELVSPSGKGHLVVFSTPLTSEDIGELVYRRGEDGLLTYVPETDTLGVEIASHKLDVAFKPQDQSVLIRTATTFKAAGNGEDFFIIRFSPSYKVSTVRSDTGSVNFTQAGGVVMLPRPRAQEFTYTITYGGKITTKGYAGSVTAGEAQLTNDYWYPMIARLPAPYELTVHTPPNWIAVGQGNRLSEVVDGDEKITKFDMRLPVVYYSLSAGPYKSVTTQVNGRPLTTWSLKLSEQQMKDQNELYGTIIDFYDKTFSRFPFKGYGGLSTDLYEGGALEAYSFCTWQSGAMPLEDGHEPSHTWWGGIIDNTYLQSFWNESFADWSDGFFHRESPIGNVEERRLAFVPGMNPSNDYNDGIVSHCGVFDGPVAGSLGYGKGAEVLYMLEQEMGSDKFLACARKFLSDRGEGKVGNWSDFKNAIHAVAGNGYDTFWNEWMERPGWVDFDVKNVAWKDGAVSGTVTFKGNPYHLECEALLQMPDGHRELTKFDTMQKAQGSAYTFSIPCRVKPSVVSIDPYHRILRTLAVDEYPTSMERNARSMAAYRDSAHPEYLPQYKSKSGAVPNDLRNLLLIGHPDTMPQLKRLCEKVGFEVAGNNLTYKGTTIDLTQGCAMAVIDLDGGGQCAIGLGSTRVNPDFGKSRLGLTDALGRLLRAVTDPKTQGHLTFRL